MPKAIRRILMLLLTIATALVALLTFLLGIGKNDWGERCQHDDDCKPNLVCGVSRSAPYCTQACDPNGRDTCVKGYTCVRWSPALPNDGVCRKD
jgi:hypothetical protein